MKIFFLWKIFIPWCTQKNYMTRTEDLFAKFGFLIMYQVLGYTSSSCFLHYLRYVLLAVARHRTTPPNSTRPAYSCVTRHVSCVTHHASPPFLFPLWEAYNGSHVLLIDIMIEAFSGVDRTGSQDLNVRDIKCSTFFFQAVIWTQTWRPTIYADNR